MRRKRTLPTTRQADHSTSGNVRDANGRQIQRLANDPKLQTLTPRSMARSMAELEALRYRVLELEQQLAKHPIEVLTPTQILKLPPLADQVSRSTAEFVPPSFGLHSLSTSGTKSTSELRTVHSINGTVTLNDRIATAPATISRNIAAVAPLVFPDVRYSGSAVDEAGSHDARATAFATSVLDSIDAVESNFTEANNSTRSRSSTGEGGCSSSAASPQREQTKIIIDQDGEEATVAVSQKNRLYQTLKRLSTIATIPEDELMVLKKLVDSEVGDVIKFLVDIEFEQSVTTICNKLAVLMKVGSPSKHRSLVRSALPSHHLIWNIQYPLLKVAQNLEQLRSGNYDFNATSSLSASPSKKIDVIVLVSSGAYNPIHMLHIRALYVARQYVESNYKFPVVGAFISPSHDTFVRVKNRRNPREMITKRHRLALIETAIASSSWIEVDKWEITRRRVLDYLSTLTHVRELCESHFLQYRFHVMYVCGCNTVVKLSHSALREEGFGCITVCRPAQTDMVIKHLGKTLAKTTTIVEDSGVLPCVLERASSFRVRQALAKPGTNATDIEMMVGKPVFHYLVKHEIGNKISGKVSWTDEDKQWRQEDLTYVEYTES